VACLLQPLAQARERRDITSRTRCHDQNPHQVSPVVPLCSRPLPYPFIEPVRGVRIQRTNLVLQP
jgi:hypothetical protein